MSCLQDWVDECEALIHRYIQTSRTAPIEAVRKEAEAKAAAIYESMELLTKPACLDESDREMLRAAIARINDIHKLKSHD